MGSWLVLLLYLLIPRKMSPCIYSIRKQCYYCNLIYTWIAPPVEISNKHFVPIIHGTILIKLRRLKTLITIVLAWLGIRSLTAIWFRIPRSRWTHRWKWSIIAIVQIHTPTPSLMMYHELVGSRAANLRLLGNGGRRWLFDCTTKQKSQYLDVKGS